MKSEYKNVIFTDHARQRLRQRRITQDMAVQAIKKPDKKMPEEEDKVRFVREIKDRNVQIVARYLDDEKKWMVVTAWVRGEEDPRPLWMHVLLLPWYALRLIGRVISGIMSLAGSKDRKQHNQKSRRRS